MTTPHDDQHDPQLSGLLRATVDAPPLRPGFHEELEARLAREPRRAPVVGPATHAPRRWAARLLVAAATVAAARDLTSPSSSSPPCAARRRRRPPTCWRP